MSNGFPEDDQAVIVIDEESKTVNITYTVDEITTQHINEIALAGTEDAPQYDKDEKEVVTILLPESTEGEVYEVDFKMVAPEWEEDSAWCEWVLFRNGHELRFSDAEEAEDFWGEWFVNGEKYDYTIVLIPFS